MNEKSEPMPEQLINQPRRRKWRNLAGAHVKAERWAENCDLVHGSITNPIIPPAQSLNAYELAEKFNLG